MRSLIGAIALQRLATGTYAVTRPGAGTYTQGVYVPGAATTFTIAASIQPVTNRELLRLPEGLRTSLLVKIITGTELRIATAPDGSGADVVSYRGESYQVEAVDAWNELGGAFEAIARKVGQ